MCFDIMYFLYKVYKGIVREMKKVERLLRDYMYNKQRHGKSKGKGLQ